MNISVIEYITLAVVTIGTIATLTTLIYSVIKNKRRVTVTTMKIIYEKNNKVVDDPDNASVAFIIINNMVHDINIVRIGCIESDGTRNLISLSAFHYPSVGQITVGCESRKILQMDKKWVNILKSKDFRYAYIEDTLGHVYKSKMPEDVRQIFIT